MGKWTIGSMQGDARRGEAAEEEVCGYQWCVIVPIWVFQPTFRLSSINPALKNFLPGLTLWVLSSELVRKTNTTALPQHSIHHLHFVV